MLLEPLYSHSSNTDRTSILGILYVQQIGGRLFISHLTCADMLDLPASLDLSRLHSLCEIVASIFIAIL